MKPTAKLYVWIIVGVIAVFVIISERKKVNNRTSNAIVTEGVITDKGSRAKGEKYVAYSFKVLGKQYFGTTAIQFCNNCKQCCQIGNKVKVRYERDNPNNNDLIQ